MNTTIDLAALALKIPCGECNAAPTEACRAEEIHDARVAPLADAYFAGYSASHWERHP